MKKEIIGPGDECRRLRRELDDARKEVEYYRQVAFESGEKRLRELERLSNAIAERDAAEKERMRLHDECRKTKKIEAIGMLAGGVAHDLNNVLGGIVGYPDIILAQIPQDSPARRYVTAIKDSGRMAAAIVRDVLTLAGRGIESTDIVDIGAVITEYLRSPEHERLIESHPGVFIKKKLGSDPMTVMGSLNHLSKILMNLVSNAAESIPGGDGTVWITAVNRHVERVETPFGEIPEGDYVIVEVEDTGIGIPEGDLERIFEPFYTKKVMGKSGTGLEMAVVWNTLKDNCGYIDVKSAPGEGSVFRLFFPFAGGESGVHAKGPPLPDYRGNGEKVLIVDDVKEQRDLACAMLTGLGYAVASLPGGEEAIEYVRDNPVDLVLLDMVMYPGIDGLDTYKGIIGMYPGQKTIIVSGFSEDERIKEVLRLGAAAYVKKPYVLERIGEAVRGVLKGDHG